MTTQLEQINAQIAAAQAAAKAIIPATEVAPSNVVAYQPTAVQPTAVQPGRPVKLGEMLAQTGMQVKAYMKVDKAGFYIGADTSTPIDSIQVEFEMDSIQPYFGVRYGNPAKYLKSFDRMTESRTKRSWADTINEAMRLDEKCKGDYPSADIPFRVLNDVKSKKGDVLIAAGELLGLSLSITNFKDFAAFIKPYTDLQEKGIIGNALLRGTLTAAQRTGNGNVWGAAEFPDFLIVSQDGEATVEAA